MHGDIPTKAFKILASSLGVSQDTAPLLETLGLSRTPALWIFGSPYNLGVPAAEGYIFLGYHVPHIWDEVMFNISELN